MKYLWYLMCLAFIITCQSNEPNQLHKIVGKTMGTYYIISYYSDNISDSNISKTSIDQLLLEFNNELSTYIPSSTIGQFNKSQANFTIAIDQNGLIEKPLFDHVFLASKDIFKNTNGYFDPTVMPLVNYWGFGYTEKKKSIQIDSQKVNQLCRLIGFEKISRNKSQNNIQYTKTLEGIQLDFSAIAKGYGVDIVGTYMKSMGIKNFLIDIGGEMLASGSKPQKSPWTVGISKPEEHTAVNEYVEIVKLKNIAIASSGNYRNFYQSNGHKYSHTINPKTGYTERSNLLSTSILAKDCMTADAYATACMVMGLDKAKVLIAKLPEVEACFISNKNGKLAFDYSEGWKR